MGLKLKYFKKPVVAERVVSMDYNLLTYVLPSMAFGLASYLTAADITSRSLFLHTDSKVGANMRAMVNKVNPKSGWLRVYESTRWNLPEKSLLNL